MGSPHPVHHGIIIRGKMPVRTAAACGLCPGEVLAALRTPPRLRYCEEAGGSACGWRHASALRRRGTVNRAVDAKLVVKGNARSVYAHMKPFDGSAMSALRKERASLVGKTKSRLQVSRPDVTR